VLDKNWRGVRGVWASLVPAISLTDGAVVFLLLLCVMMSACEPSSDEDKDAWVPHDILRPEPYTAIQLNVHNLSQFGVEDQGISQKLGRLSDLIGKPITLFHIQAVDEALSSWDFASLEEYLERSDAPRLAENVFPMEVLFVEGIYENEGEEPVLGLSWGGNRVALFLGTLRPACENPELFSSRAEQVAACKFAANQVLTHEFGHLLGLVNNGIPMVNDHLAPQFEHHDRDPECLMYWANSRARIFEKFASRSSSQDDWFCDACQEDIHAAIGE
jgi:hypothetical protein